MKGKLLFLGTGASAGVPVIACTCAVCKSSSPYNKRLRPSALLQMEKKQILIDPGPDLREQALRYGIDDLDGVILTHSHYDHIGGIDDLRSYFLIKQQPLPCLASKDTYEEVSKRAPYLFQPKKEGQSLSAQLDFHSLQEDFCTVSFIGWEFRIVSYSQGGQKVTGFRLGTLAFISDIRHFSPRVIEEIKGVKTLVVSALRETPSAMHFHFEEAIDFSRAVGAERTWLTHLSHEVDHEAVSRKLPSNIALAYDGLAIDFTYTN
jgi:phosphoribosyl 1,2-cyclic phosphate phosphodiesterase